MNSRIVAAALVALVVWGVTGCAPQSEPQPTASTGFATDAEAFAAAEETYRLYVDALNQVDLSDPATFEEVYRWTTGDANANERKNFTQMHADRWTVSGVSEPTVVEPLAALTPDGTISLAVCLDVSSVDVVDANGVSVVNEERGRVQSALVTLAQSDASPTRLVIAAFDGREGEPLCE